MNRGSGFSARYNLREVRQKTAAMAAGSVKEDRVGPRDRCATNSSSVRRRGAGGYLTRLRARSVDKADPKNK